MGDDDRVAVQAYLPRYQREEWRSHADELGMSLSEFVRVMVQGGRRGIDSVMAPETRSGASADHNPWGERLETHLLEALSADQYLTWDELVAEVTNRIEDDLETALEQLQEQNSVVHNGREDGYTLASDD